MPTNVNGVAGKTRRPFFNEIFNAVKIRRSSLKTFTHAPEGTTIISEKDLRIQEFYANQYLSDMECYTFLKSAHLADMVFSKNPSKIVWAKFVKRYGKNVIQQAYNYWLSYAGEV